MAKIFDATAIGLCVGQTLGWVGALLHGANFGAVSDSQFALDLPDLFGLIEPRFPLQHAEIILFAGWFVALVMLALRQAQPGTLFIVYALIAYGAFLAALVLGFGFGLALELAGFGSSRKLSGIFYFRDMTVLKVMFTAMITAMLGLHLLMTVGVIQSDQIYLLPTVYGAQIIGGLIFGVGFAMAAWCPGTAAVGAASGRLDAVIFLVGAVVGSVLFNEVYSSVVSVYHWGDAGVKFVWAALGMSSNVFVLLFA